VKLVIAREQIFAGILPGCETLCVFTPASGIGVWGCSDYFFFCCQFLSCVW